MQPVLRLMDEPDVARVHEGALQILDRVGVRFGSSHAETLLQEAGQRWDPQTRTVRLAPDLVERCLTQLPNQVLLAARDLKRDVLLGSGRVHTCLDGQGTFTLDSASGVRRPSTLQDLVAATRLSDALQSLDFYWPPIVPSDVPDSVRTLVEAVTGFTHTSRHVQHEVKTEAHVPFLLEMLDVLLGDRRRHRERPVFSLTVCPVSPLQHEAEMTTACLELARHFVPICLMPMPLAGATAPVTVAGTVVQTVAEFLSGVVLYQLAQPGCPMILGVGSTILDMHAGLYSAGAPELPLMNLALVEMGRRYRVPVMAQGFVSDAKAPGAQAAWEKTVRGLVAALAGSDAINGLGLLDSHQTLSQEQLVIDDEICRTVRRVASGFEADARHLLLDLVSEVGIGGNFLGKRTTLDFLRAGEHFEARLSHRGPYDAWLGRGKSEVDLARERAVSLLSRHEVLPLQGDVAKALDGIVERAAKATAAGERHG